MKEIRIPLAALALFLSLTLTACGGGSENAEDTPEGDSTQVVKVEPQDFPVNDLPESQFGKDVMREPGAVELPEANLAPADRKFPAWLDAIVSRESIVLFAKGVLAEMPDELEFVQTNQTHFAGPDGWSAFAVEFTTRPSGAGMVIYGAYESEEASYWASAHASGPPALALTAVEPMDGGVAVLGTRGAGDTAQPFRAELTKESAKEISGE